MEISCNVIKDILPLYAEDMTGDETIQTVNDVAESLIPVHRRARVNPAASPVRHAEGEG